MKNIRKLFLVIVSLCILAPVVFFNFKVDTISNIDNRKLTAMPLGKSGIDYSKEWINYINDRIGARDRAINLYTTLNDKLFNEMIHPTYEYGKDDYIFFKLSSYKMDYDYLDTYISLIENIQTYCTERGVPFIYVINPKKDTIYSQYLPSGYNYNNEKLAYIMKKLDEKGINYVDNVSLLQEKSKTEMVFNKKYDAGHWNDLGAFYGVNNIISKIQEYYPEVKLNNIDNFNVLEKTQESLPVSNFKISEKVPSITVKETIKEKFVKGGNLTSLKLDKQHSFFTYNKFSNKINDVKAMYLQGSYLNGRTEMLWSSVQECYNIHSYQNAINFGYYYNAFQPNIVIFENAEYALGESFYKLEDMKKKVFNPVFDIENAIAITPKVEMKNNGSLAAISVHAEKSKYAYIKMGETVFDLIWDKEKQIYYADISVENIETSYKVYAINE